MLLSQYFEVDTSHAGTRLDRFLAEQMPWRSRNAWKTLIAEHAVLVQQKIALPSLLLQRGWKIEAAQGFEDIFQLESLGLHEKALVVPPIESRQKAPLLWQDEWLVAIDKPAGMPSHPLKTDEQNTALHAFLAVQPSVATAGPKLLEGGLIHRLDTQTSGVLIAACTPAAFEQMVQNFRLHKARKNYLAIVHGELVTSSGEELVIDMPLAHHLKDSRRMVVVHQKQDPFRGKPRAAESRVRVISSTKTHSLLEVTVQQAQMHQIRAHLAGIGHPLIADAIYAKQTQRQIDESEIHRHALHASRVVMQHPADSREITIEAVLPADMRRACERLGLRLRGLVD